MTLNIMTIAQQKAYATPRLGPSIEPTLPGSVPTFSSAPGQEHTRHVVHMGFTCVTCLHPGTADLFTLHFESV